MALTKLSIVGLCVSPVSTLSSLDVIISKIHHMRMAISSFLAFDLQLFFNFSDGQMSDLEISPPPRSKRNSMPRKSNENSQSSSHDKIVKRQHQANSSSAVVLTKKPPNVITTPSTGCENLKCQNCTFIQNLRSAHKFSLPCNLGCKMV